MKNISILFCAFLLATTTLVGCDNFGDDDKNEPTTCYFGGCIDLQKIPTITKETFKRQIVGKGWKHEFTQEMNANGTIAQKSYYNGLIGISPIDFYFTEGSVTSFMLSDALTLLVIRLYRCAEVVRDDGVSSLTHNLRRRNMSPYNPILHLRALQEKNRATSHL